MKMLFAKATPAVAGPVGEHDLHHLLCERVEALSRSRPVASQGGGELVAGAPSAPTARRLSVTWRERREKAALVVEPEGAYGDESSGGGPWCLGMAHAYLRLAKKTDLEHCLLLLGCLPLFRALLRYESYLLGCSPSATGREGGGEAEGEANLFTLVGPGHCSH
jgi:hypothetical protein